MSLHNYKARFYSSELGRFLQNDPIRFNAGDFNLYRYVGNIPTCFTDTAGLQADARNDLPKDAGEPYALREIQVYGTRNAKTATRSHEYTFIVVFVVRDPQIADTLNTQRNDVNVAASTIAGAAASTPAGRVGQIAGAAAGAIVGIKLNREIRTIYPGDHLVNLVTVTPTAKNDAGFEIVRSFAAHYRDAEVPDSMRNFVESHKSLGGDGGYYTDFSYARMLDLWQTRPVWDPYELGY